MDLDAGHHTDAFDPGAGEVPGRVATALERISTDTLLIVAGSDARRSGWAEHAALALARTWSRRGVDVILADLCLDDPILHYLVDLDNDEGVSDVILFGASLDRTVRRVSDSGLALLPAGYYTPDSEAVLAHSRWGRLLGQAHRARRPLWLYVPATAQGLDALASRIEHAIVLASPGEALAVAGVLPGNCAVAAVLTPGGPDSALTASPIAVDEVNPSPDHESNDVEGTITAALEGELSTPAGMDRAAVSAAVDAWLASIDAGGTSTVEEASGTVGTEDAEMASADEPTPVPADAAVATPTVSKGRGDVLLGGPESAAVKRGRTGWIVAGVVLLVVAAAAVGWYLLGL